MKKNARKACDELWAEVVKLKAQGKCEFCGKTSYLNAHHIFSRSKSSTRHDVDNGICLCVAHHVFSSAFSAHKTPAEFIEWIKVKRGEVWYKRLRLRADSVYKPDYELIKLELKQLKQKYN